MAVVVATVVPGTSLPAPVGLLGGIVDILSSRKASLDSLTLNILRAKLQNWPQEAVMHHGM